MQTDRQQKSTQHFFFFYIFPFLLLDVALMKTHVAVQTENRLRLSLTEPCLHLVPAITSISLRVRQALPTL